eukprot:scaffold12.g8050.t1
MAAALDFGAPLKQTVYENTYQLGPSEAARFQQQKVERLLHVLLAERLAGRAYDPVHGSQLAKQLADDVRERVKGLGFVRHKLVVQVTVGEKKGQAVTMVSRGLWDAHTDGHASVSIETETLFCNCQVYALYFE